MMQTDNQESKVASEEIPVGRSTVRIEGAGENALTAKSGSKAPSGKLFIAVLAVLALFVAGMFGAFNYVKSNFISGKSDKGGGAVVSAVGVPDDIGSASKLPTAEISESSGEIASEAESLPNDGEPASVAGANSPVEEENSLPSRRLESGIAAFSAPAEVDTPKRGAMVMKNIDYTLVKGTKIPCTLETNVVSEQSGFTSCIVSRDVYGGNARVLLLEKGTRVTGEYRAGDVKNGDTRLQIVWDRLITPHDIVVQIASPVVDRLGAAGAVGEVDNRWGKRIGSALLISMFSDALTILADKKQDAEVIVDSETSETTQDMAKDILRHNIDLPPIIYIREGEIVNIYVADDIDLSDIYEVRRAG